MKTLSSEVLHTNPWWKYKHDTYELPDGSVGNYYYAQTRGMSIVIPVMFDGRILIIKQYRYLNQRDCWEFPGGGLKEGQTPEDAARAELQEEAGLLASDLTFLAEAEPSNGFVKDRTYFWLAHAQVAQANNPDNSELITEIKHVTALEFDCMIAQGEIWDGQTLSAWCLAKAKGLV